MSILLTGGNGFLGNYLSKNIQKTKIVHFERSNPVKTPWNEIKSVVHCAGLAHNSHNERLRESYFNANVKLTKELISGFLRSKANVFIYISTSTIYDGISGEKELNEEIIGKSLSIYAQSKLQAEKELLKIQDKKKIFILRPSIIVGPNPKGNLALLERLIEFKGPILLPAKTAPKSLTDIRNIKDVVEYLLSNYANIESGIYNVNDNIKPNIEVLLKTMSKNKGKNLRIIKINNYILKIILKFMSALGFKSAKKFYQLFFISIIVSNKKISKLLKLKYNSYQ